jgi:hypothetical protein
MSPERPLKKRGRPPADPLVGSRRCMLSLPVSEAERRLVLFAAKGERLTVGAWLRRHAVLAATQSTGLGVVAVGGGDQP